MTVPIDQATLRTLVREIVEQEIRTALACPRTTGSAKSAGNDAGESNSAEMAELIRLVRRVTDADRLLSDASHPQAGNARGTSMARPGGSDVSRAPSNLSGTHAFEGVVTERVLKALPGDVKVAYLGPDAIVTPLARDLARDLGIKFERTNR